MADDFSFVKNSGEVKTGVTKHVLKVVGIGGCGNKTLNHLITQGLDGPEYIAINSDPQDLDNCLAAHKILIGEKTTKMRGCGGDPELGRLACVESLEKIKNALAGTDMLFITAGMGGGTGSGAAPVVAQAMAEMEDSPLIVAVVATPFEFENRMKVADEVVRQLTELCSCIITISNEKLQRTAPKGTTLLQAKALGNDILAKAVAGIIEILTKPGDFNNLDFRDIQAVMSVKGPGLIGMGEASGEDRGKKALKNAITSPLLGNASIKGAKRILVNFTADESVLLEEYTEVNMLAVQEADPDAKVYSGWVTDNTLAKDGVVKITIIATGIGDQSEWEKPEKGEEEIITLDNLAEDEEIGFRGEKEPVQPGVREQQLPAAPQVRTFTPKPLMNPAQPRVQASQIRQPLSAQGARRPTKYEVNQAVDPGPAPPKLYGDDFAEGGVDPVNNNPKKFEKPSFMRKGLS
ncbi:MAG: cell division FtsZ family protein [Deltaproteobacteria bacterium]|jgi:cell division protein FtsZ|nr:cell division FtsZ family protein [Deltaproteobacteria bacterium]